MGGRPDFGALGAAPAPRPDFASLGASTIVDSALQPGESPDLKARARRDFIAAGAKSVAMTQPIRSMEPVAPDPLSTAVGETMTDVGGNLVRNVGEAVPRMARGVGEMMRRPTGDTVDEALAATGSAAMAVAPQIAVPSAIFQAAGEQAKSEAQPPSLLSDVGAAPQKAFELEHEYVGKPVEEFTGSKTLGMAADLAPFVAAGGIDAMRRGRAPAPEAAPFGDRVGRYSPDVETDPAEYSAPRARPPLRGRVRGTVTPVARPDFGRLAEPGKLPAERNAETSAPVLPTPEPAVDVPRGTPQEAPGSTPEPTPPASRPAEASAETPATPAAADVPEASPPDEVTHLGSGGGPEIEKAIADAQKPGGKLTAVFGKAKNWFRTLGPNGPEFADRMGDALSRADSIRGREAIDYNMARDRLSAKQRAAAGDLKTGLKAWMHGEAAPPEWAKPLVAGARKAWDRFVDVLNESGSRIVEIRNSDEMPEKIPESWVVSERKAGTFETDEAGDFKGKPGEWTVVRPIEKGARPFPTSPSTEALAALDAENAAGFKGPKTVTEKLQAANPDVDVAKRFEWNPEDEASVARQKSRAESFFAGNERAHVLEWPDELQSQNGLETFDRYLDRSAQNAAEHEVFKYRYETKDGGPVKNEGDFRRGINRISATEGSAKAAEAEHVATRLLGRNRLDAATPQALRTWNQFSGAASGVSKLAGSVNNYFMHAMHGAFGAARMGPAAYGKGLVKALFDYGESKRSAIEKGVLHPKDDVLRQMGAAPEESLAPYADKPTAGKKVADATSTAARVLTYPNNWIVQVARMAASNAADAHVESIRAALGREGAANRMAGRDASWAEREMTRLDLSPADKAKLRGGEMDQALRDKVAQNVSSATNLSAALQDKPRMMTSPKAQSLITFKGVHVAAMREFADNALREAANGNLLPLVQMTAASIVLYEASQATKTAMTGPPKDDAAPRLEDVKTPSGALRFALHALAAEGAAGFIAPAAESVIPDEHGKIELAQEIARTAAPPWASDVGNLAAAPGRDWWTTFKLVAPQAAKIVEAAGYRTSPKFVRSRLEKATKDEGTEAKKGQGGRVKWLLDREKSLAPFEDSKK